MDLSISIVNHSNPELLRGCLNSVFATTRGLDFEVWVIDNATGGRLVPELRAQFPDVRWIMNEKQLGFSANHNQMLRATKARYALILNDDTIIHEKAFSELIGYLDRNPSAAMAAPQLLNGDGSIQNSTFNFMTLRSELIDICYLPRSLCFLKQKSIDPAQFGAEPANVDWALGACLVIRQTDLKSIGVLDERLSPIANTEEVDWCYRIHQQGREVVFVPTARVTHIGGQSLRPANNLSPAADPIRVEMYRTRLAFMRKHHGAIKTLLLQFIYVVTLPYNLIMLRQSYFRGRISRYRLKADSLTLRQIALAALRFSTRQGVSMEANDYDSFASLHST